MVQLIGEMLECLIVVFLKGVACRLEIVKSFITPTKFSMMPFPRKVPVPPFYLPPYQVNDEHSLKNLGFITFDLAEIRIAEKFTEQCKKKFIPIPPTVLVKSFAHLML